jgi:hypothetical protein
MIEITPKGYGHWNVDIMYYGKKIGITLDDAKLIDAIRDGDKASIKLVRKCIIELHKIWWSC